MAEMLQHPSVKPPTRAHVRHAGRRPLTRVATTSIVNENVALSTYMAKQRWYGMVPRPFVLRLVHIASPLTMFIEMGPDLTYDRIWWRV